MRCHRIRLTWAWPGSGRQAKSCGRLCKNQRQSANRRIRQGLHEKAYPAPQHAGQRRNRNFENWFHDHHCLRALEYVATIQLLFSAASNPPKAALRVCVTSYYESVLPTWNRLTPGLTHPGQAAPSPGASFLGIGALEVKIMRQESFASNLEPDGHRSQPLRGFARPSKG